MNKFLQTINYCADNKYIKPYPTRIEIKRKETKGWVAIDQMNCR